MGHEHPTVRLEDEVGGSRVERAWLRGRLEPSAFVGHVDRNADGDADEGWDADTDIEGDRNGDSPGPGDGTELVVFPAFNDRSGGTWVNVEGQEFLAPFLPDALPDGELYLLDGTRLGHYRRV